MAWQVGDLGDCFDEWAAGKNDHERFRLLKGLIELADRPLDESPGSWIPDRSPMLRLAIIDSTFQQTLAFIRVYESQGVFDVIDLQDIF